MWISGVIKLVLFISAISAQGSDMNFNIMCAHHSFPDLTPVYGRDLGLTKSHFFESCVRQRKATGVKGLALLTECEFTRIKCVISLTAEHLTPTDCHHIKVLHLIDSHLVVDKMIMDVCHL